jgi:hypothetical protein
MKVVYEHFVLRKLFKKCADMAWDVVLQRVFMETVLQPSSGLLITR